METSSVAEKNIIFRFIFTIFAFRYLLILLQLTYVDFSHFHHLHYRYLPFFFLKCDHKKLCSYVAALYTWQNNPILYLCNLTQQVIKYTELSAAHKINRDRDFNVYKCLLICVLIQVTGIKYALGVT